MAECRDIQGRLSLFSDGLLAPAEHADVRAHLRECTACGGVLEDIERIKGAARELGPIAPPEHVWLEVAGSVRLAGQRPEPVAAPAQPRSVFWQWTGLSAALVVITGLLYVFQGAPEMPPEAPLSQAASAPVEGTPATGSIEAVNEELDLALTHYSKAIAELETIATSGSDEMEPEVATTVQHNLSALDAAIAESREALTQDPESTPARESLFEALRRKVTVLQATASLINEMRQGDPEGAAQAAENLGKKS